MASDARTGALAAADLFSLESYHTARPEFRARVLEHKKHRQVAIGPELRLYFEDRLTVQYQIQEMLRIERIFEREAIEEELEAYNPLIPDGGNLKATFMIEIPDPDARRARLAELSRVEDSLYTAVGSGPKILCVADEDLDRSEPDKTSAVHFVRFEYSAADRAALKSGAELRFGVEHPSCRVETTVTGATRDSLLADLD